MGSNSIIRSMINMVNPVYATGLKRASEDQCALLWTEKEFIDSGGSHDTIAPWLCRYGQLHQTPMNKVGLCKKHKNGAKNYRTLQQTAIAGGITIKTTYDAFMALGGKMKSKITWICPAGMEHETTGQQMVCKRHAHCLEQYRAFKGKAAGRKWGIISEVQAYQNTTSKLEAICDNGHQQEKSHDSFNHDHFCCCCVNNEKKTANPITVLSNVETIGNFEDRVLGIKWCRQEFKREEVVTAIELINPVSYGDARHYRPLIEIAGANMYVEVRSPRNATMDEATVTAKIMGAVASGYDVLVLTFDDMDQVIEEELYGCDWE